MCSGSRKQNAYMLLEPLKLTPERKSDIFKSMQMLIQTTSFLCFGKMYSKLHQNSCFNDLLVAFFVWNFSPPPDVNPHGSTLCRVYYAHIYVSEHVRSCVYGSQVFLEPGKCGIHQLFHVVTWYNQENGNFVHVVFENFGA